MGLGDKVLMIGCAVFLANMIPNLVIGVNQDKKARQIDHEVQTISQKKIQAEIFNYSFLVQNEAQYRDSLKLWEEQISDLNSKRREHDINKDKYFTQMLFVGYFTD